MKKFKFLGDGHEYGWAKNPEKGEFYNIDQINEMVFDADRKASYTEKDLIRFPDQWQEVVEPLLKDTDFGYFAGLAMQSLISTAEIDPSYVCRLSVQYAKSLIEELRKETKNGEMEKN
jgi:hypothetical protein